MRILSRILSIVMISASFRLILNIFTALKHMNRISHFFAFVKWILKIFGDIGEFCCGLKKKTVLTK